MANHQNSSQYGSSQNEHREHCRRICIYCGSRPGNHPRYAENAKYVGKLIAEHDIDLVYGGSTAGTMGMCANAVLEHGGGVHGVIPDFLRGLEPEHPGITKLYIVQTMHERKRLMADLSSGFIAMPGGFGTLEETMEIITWSILGLHNKPVGILNFREYYTPLWQHLQHSLAEGFLGQDHLTNVIFEADPDKLMEKMLPQLQPVSLADAEAPSDKEVR